MVKPLSMLITSKRRMTGSLLLVFLCKRRVDIMSNVKETKHNFGERSKEFYKGSEIEVGVSDKYLESRKKACEMIESDKYGLSDGDFWILKNKVGTKLYYSGLIISHQGVQKINDHLEDELKFKEEYCSDPAPYEYGGRKGLIMCYRDKRDGLLEYGEISEENCKNEYPYAMLLKRTFDRVVLVKSKLKFYGIYGEDEADEFVNSEIKVNEQTGEVTTELKKEKENEPELSDSMSLEEASNHKIISGSQKLVGLSPVKFVVECKPGNEQMAKNILVQFATQGHPKDAAACKAVLRALEQGQLNFPRAQH